MKDIKDLSSKGLTQDNIEIVDDNEEEKTDFLLRIVPEHRKVSREVIEGDEERVLAEAKILYNICYSKNGPYNGAIAMAHPQIDDKDPLRFFVTAEAELIINPEIIRETNFKIDSREGCYTYPGIAPKKDVKRSNKIDVQFQTIEEDGKLSRIGFMSLSGRWAKVWQHEMDHLDAKYIYD